MAKINEQKITIRLSRLERDDEPSQSVLSEENLAVLIEALSEMVGSQVLIELE